MDELGGHPHCLVSQYGISQRLLQVTAVEAHYSADFIGPCFVIPATFLTWRLGTEH